jgi:hypothetical protein
MPMEHDPNSHLDTNTQKKYLGRKQRKDKGSRGTLYPVSPFLNCPHGNILFPSFP